MYHPPLDREVMIKSENPHFTRKNVEALAEWLGNPDWMRQARLKYFDLFGELPMPGRRDEEWRRTDISRLTYAEYLPFDTESQYSAENLPRDFAPQLPSSAEAQGVLVAVDGRTVQSRLETSLQQQGVIWTDLRTAVREHPDLVQKYFMQSVAADDENKFTALNAAFWNSGMFLYVPPGVELTLPLHMINWYESTAVVHNPHTVIVLDRGARAVYFEEFLSAERERQAWVNSMTEIFVETGAEFQYISLQNLSTNVYTFAHRRAVAQKDARMDWLIGTFGSALTKSTISSILNGEGAETRMLGLAIGEKGRFIDQNTHQIHEAPHTRSDLLFKNAITAGGRAVYRGVIRIAQHAQRSDAYQANRNLVLGDGARAESIPALEIIANDVRCTHGATVGKIDPDQLFYLMSRGLSRDEAVRLLVNGFFFPVIEHIADTYISERMLTIVEERTAGVEV